jgi:hypothetical protein
MAALTQQQLMEQLVQLTDAVKDLAQHQVGRSPGLDGDRPTGDDDRIRQRVAFSYQALGALTGRVGSATGREFDVRVVEARREPGAVLLRRLPAGAEWVELRTGAKVETLRLRRDHDHDHDHDGDHDGGVDLEGRGLSDAERRERRDRRHRGRVHPEDFADDEPIGSIVVLRGRLGPLVAFGPRLPGLRAAVAQPAGGIPTGPTTVPAGSTPGT